MSLCPLWVLVERPGLCWAQRPLQTRVWSLSWPQAPTVPLFPRRGANRPLRDTNSLLLPHLSHEVHELLASFLHPPEWSLLPGGEMGFIASLHPDPWGLQSLLLTSLILSSDQSLSSKFSPWYPPPGSFAGHS